MPNKEELIKTAEKEIENLENELSACDESKSRSDVCSKLCNYVEGVDSNEPFSSNYDVPNSWHKNVGGGGGCVIL